MDGLRIPAGKPISYYGMVSTQIHFIFVLVLSLVALVKQNIALITGNCGESVTCKTSGAEIHYLSGKTAKSDDYEYITSVPQFQLHMCHERCKAYCVEEGPRGFDPWPNCKAFSSYVKVGGTCYCYGWSSKPSWYSDSDYKSGWCEK
ncbi:hypothetical protein OS493_029177 [Desmophyllum pertusum]|uniref:Uncharacterized protein n=1 Tax=Desmophyllum pertusum TaxID=174260 RepID=A0A9X0D711_9CNID|nr:hypothetical protein OS493_029177 [Desmophyllum pertusum]